MSGLLALLDDVAAIAKLAAAQVDDIAGQAAKVGAKTAGVIIDDTAVTPKYVAGLAAARELPIVWKIARASAFNKIVILLPVALLLSAFAPWALTPLLMLGGAYLCFEGGEKVLHLLMPHAPDADHQDAPPVDPVRLEKSRVRGAIKTDFILSAEIMTIALAAIETDSTLVRAGVLAMVAILITAAVYGAVAALVKADDVGLAMASGGRFQATRNAGRAIVRHMPKVMTTISTVGTAAMLWVGGSILVHGFAGLGWAAPEHLIDGIAETAAHAVPAAAGAVQWIVKAAIDGVLGLLVGLALVPIVTRAIAPAVAALRGKPAGASSH